MNALLLGYYGNRNLGDELMLGAIAEWLAAQDVRVTVLSEDPEVTRERTGLPAILNVPLLGQWNWKRSYLEGEAFRLIRALARADGLIVGGGDLIRDDMGWNTFTYVMEKIVVALLMRKPVYFVSVGLGVPRSWRARRLLGWALRRARKIIVRDRRSVALCESLGCARTTVLAPDIAAYLPRLLDRAEAATPAAPAESPADPTRSAPFALVCLRGAPDVFGAYRFDDAQAASVAEALDSLAGEFGLDVRFVPMQRANDDDDHDQHLRVAGRMTARAILDDRTPGIPEALRLFAQARVVVAMRLHAAVLAATFGKPCIFLPYDVKCVEFARSANITTLLSSDELLDRGAVRACVRRALLDEPPAAIRDSASVWESITLLDQPATGRPVA